MIRHPFVDCSFTLMRPPGTVRLVQDVRHRLQIHLAPAQAIPRVLQQLASDVVLAGVQLSKCGNWVGRLTDGRIDCRGRRRIRPDHEERIPFGLVDLEDAELQTVWHSHPTCHVNPSTCPL